MKPGINREAAVFKVRLAVMLLCVLAWTGAPLPVFANGAARDPRLALSVMEKEAYFYFFLEDYLNTAMHLKLLENAATVKKDEGMLHQSRYLSGGLYLSWGMHTPAARIFNDLLTAFPAGKKRNEVFLAIGRMRYERALYLPALETFRRFEPNDIFPGSDEAVYLAGMSHHALGAMKEGNAALSRIRPESRFYPYARLALAKSYFVLEEVEASLNLLEELSQYETSG
ncbi:MAG: tol-pal system YbgF family protein, partial [Nitrospiria bacterium]